MAMHLFLFAAASVTASAGTAVTAAVSTLFVRLPHRPNGQGHNGGQNRNNDHISKHFCHAPFLYFPAAAATEVRL